MKKMKRRTLENVMITVFMVLQGLAFYFIWKFYYNHELKNEYLFKGNALMVVVYVAIAYFIYKSLDGLRVSVNSMYALAVSHFISAVITDMLFYLILIIIFRGITGVGPLARLLLINWIISALWVYICKRTMQAKTGRHCILFYIDDDPEYLKQKFEDRKDQFTIVKMVKVTSLENIENEFTDGIDSAVIAYMPSDYRNEIVKICFRKDIEVIVTPKVSDVLIRGAEELNILDGPLFVIETANSKSFQIAVKRAFDVCFSAFALLIASPIMAATALAIKLEDRGPVFYKQKRCTIDGKEFEIYKFRSMIVNAEKNNKAVLASKNDSRITKVGKFIRATRIDEIPQLINIMKGDMSVVGPRPERKALIDQYSDIVEAFPYRMKVKAGLTGYAQLMGKYNSNPYNKLLFDLMYVQKFSLLLDLRLILLTLKIVFMKESTEGVDEEFERFIESFNRTKGKNTDEE
ncbi:MAG: exopolysaccharide biosynthesis polyprenyl glycosylphosphotransferase [Clostridia bacterium]|nr:exopolysaccharide biosynthesis polyprenyl glycosylphosphotransferase [Clostridia bacterium]